MASRALIVISLCFVTVLQLAGADSAPDKLNGLLNNSPFGQSRANAVAGSGASDPLEFRAVLEEKGNRFFSIYDTATHRSVWVELNDPVNGFSIKGYDAGHENVTVEFHDKSMTLSLKRAAAVAQVAAPGPQMPGSGMPANGVPGNAMPAASNPSGIAVPGTTDQQRIQQIQEEIRRRRALRQQSAVPAGSPRVQSGGEGGPRPMPANSTGPQPLPPKT